MDKVDTTVATMISRICERSRSAASEARPAGGKAKPRCSTAQPERLI
jgi:hypothetical protein